MIFRRFLYGIKEGTRNIFRNKMFSLASLGTIIACVFLLGTFLSVALNVRSTMQQMEQSVGISVFNGATQTAPPTDGFEDVTLLASLDIYFSSFTS